MNPALRLLKNYAIALVVAGALIWFPYTGFFVTIFTFGLLPALICNLFLIHLTVTVWDRKISPAWLIVPIACYGTWLGWAVWKNHAVTLERSRIESRNRVTGPLPQNVTLVFPEDGLEVARIAKAHLAPSVRVFVGSVELSAIDGNHTICMLPRPNDPPFMKDHRCPIEPMSQPPADAIVFRELERPALENASPPFLWQYALTRNSATTGNPVVGHFTFGWFRSPVWAPVFVAGCVLIDHPSSWQCDIGPMMRNVTVGETEYPAEYDPWHGHSDKAVATLADMLGLRYVASTRK